ncbi:hypothetical protein [Bacillus coahuilensis]|uniref:hypothetical protein n=1 Tax=Bacillus coahuilensis TaxID=408580 RepID=UPI00018509B6|nr:hypothetical protein [Bacillus coahuilensis]
MDILYKFYRRGFYILLPSIAVALGFLLSDSYTKFEYMDSLSIVLVFLLILALLSLSDCLIEESKNKKTSDEKEVI